MSIRIFRDESEKYPAQINIEYSHSHSTKSLQSLSFKDIPDHVSKTIHELFQKGYTPGLAYREMMQDLKSKSTDDLDLHLKLADRSQMPRRRDFNNLYTDYHRRLFGTANIKEMFKNLEERISSFQQSNPDNLVKLQHFNAEENVPLILCIITPLMQRVHEKVPTAAELVFIDSTSNTEEFNLRVFLLVTHTPIGVLPLGILFTSDETTDTLIQALELYLALLPDLAFYKRGKRRGPSVFMTDNCSELRDALKNTWPESTLLLCIFHILQQVWRWLFDKNNGIAAGDRPGIMTQFKRVLYQYILNSHLT
uniref:MULE transposase domain-containing protein n=1 Tax=Clytia hemisphaerica TaxID=252671 RepID=A0A7M5V8P8_9CNID